MGDRQIWELCSDEQLPRNLVIELKYYGRMYEYYMNKVCSILNQE